MIPATLSIQMKYIHQPTPRRTSPSQTMLSHTVSSACARKHRNSRHVQAQQAQNLPFANLHISDADAA